MEKATIAKVQGFGFDIYMRNPTDSYMLFTDGTHIGYLQNDRLAGYTISTVHMPNQTSGTGFQIKRHADAIDKSDLERCFDTAPSWVGTRERQSVRKYANMAAYLKSNSWHAGYSLVPPVTETSEA